MKTEITGIEDIRRLVDAFYSKVREDELLSGIFNKVIGEHWPAHMEKMYRFWQTVLLEEHTYSGNPFAHHMHLPVDKEHFERWIDLFYQTLDELFTGEKADEAKWRAAKIAALFHSKIEQLRKHP